MPLSQTAAPAAAPLPAGDGLSEAHGAALQHLPHSTSLLAHLIELGHLPFLLLFLVLHLISSPFWPLKPDARPFLWRLFGNAGHELARRLNKSSRSEAELRQRGRLVIVLMGAFAVLIGLSVDMVDNYAYGWLFTLLFVTGGVTALMPIKVLRALEKLDDKDVLIKGRALLQPYHLEDLSAADAATLRRKAIIWSAKAFTRYLTAPCLFFAVAGPVGLALGVALLAMSEAYSPLGVSFAELGRPLRWLDKICIWLPAFVSALVICLSAAFVSGGHPGTAFKLMFRDARRYHPTHDGFLVAAAAGALGITLGGSVRYPDSHIAAHEWIGAKNSSAQLTTNDLGRARLLFFVSFLWIIVLLSAFLSAAVYFHK